MLYSEQPSRGRAPAPAVVECGGGLEAQLVPASGKQRRGGGESLSKHEGPSGHRVSTTPSLHFF